MPTKYHILMRCKIHQGDKGCRAQTVAEWSGISTQQAALCLLRCYRAGLLKRERQRFEGSDGRRVYHYSLTRRGQERLAWYQRSAVTKKQQTDMSAALSAALAPLAGEGGARRDSARKDKRPHHPGQAFQERGARTMIPNARPARTRASRLQMQKSQMRLGTTWRRQPTTATKKHPGALSTPGRADRPTGGGSIEPRVTYLLKARGSLGIVGARKEAARWLSKFSTSLAESHSPPLR